MSINYQEEDPTYEFNSSVENLYYALDELEVTCLLYAEGTREYIEFKSPSSLGVRLAFEVGIFQGMEEYAQRK